MCATIDSFEIAHHHRSTQRENNVIAPIEQSTTSITKQYLVVIFDESLHNYVIDATYANEQQAIAHAKTINSNNDVIVILRENATVATSYNTWVATVRNGNCHCS